MSSLLTVSSVRSLALLCSQDERTPADSQAAAACSMGKNARLRHTHARWKGPVPSATTFLYTAASTYG